MDDRAGMVADGRIDQAAIESAISCESEPEAMRETKRDNSNRTKHSMKRISSRIGAYGDNVDEDDDDDDE